jgi:hypothetical protein
VDDHIGQGPDFIRADSGIYSFEGVAKPFVARDCGATFAVMGECMLVRPCLDGLCVTCSFYG